MSKQIVFATGECVLGTVLVATSERGVCAILLGDDAGRLAGELQLQFPRDSVREAGAQVQPVLARVVRFLAAPAAGLDLPLDTHGTDFQQRVWSALLEIPAGTTQSYAEVARRIGAPQSAKEVGEACAANVLAVAIPCHRVLRKDGALAGYRWGVARKRALLLSESVST